jgi:pyruvate/oxaloacetate carboxyltransferase
MISLTISSSFNFRHDTHSNFYKTLNIWSVFFSGFYLIISLLNYDRNPDHVESHTKFTLIVAALHYVTRSPVHKADLRSQLARRLMQAGVDAMVADHEGMFKGSLATKLKYSFAKKLLLFFILHYLQVF